MTQIVGDGMRGSPERRDSFRLDVFLWGGQQFTSHFREGLAEFRDFTAAARRDRIRVVASGERPDARDQIIQGARNRTRDKTQQQQSEQYGRYSDHKNRAVEIVDETDRAAQRNE